MDIQEKNGINFSFSSIKEQWEKNNIVCPFEISLKSKFLYANFETLPEIFDVNTFNFLFDKKYRIETLSKNFLLDIFQGQKINNKITLLILRLNTLFCYLKNNKNPAWILSYLHFIFRDFLLLELLLPPNLSDNKDFKNFTSKKFFLNLIRYIYANLCILKIKPELLNNINFNSFESLSYSVFFNTQWEKKKNELFLIIMIFIKAFFLKILIILII